MFQVKSFDGKIDPTEHFPEYQPSGTELVCEFHDGEVIRACALRPYDPGEKRFFIVPSDSSGNNISILIEASALKEVYSVQEYTAHKAKEQEQVLQRDSLHSSINELLSSL